MLIFAILLSTTIYDYHHVSHVDTESSRVFNVQCAQQEEVKVLVETRDRKPPEGIVPAKKVGDGYWATCPRAFKRHGEYCLNVSWTREVGGLCENSEVSHQRVATEQILEQNFAEAALAGVTVNSFSQ